MAADVLQHVMAGMAGAVQVCQEQLQHRRQARSGNVCTGLNFSTTMMDVCLPGGAEMHLHGLGHQELHDLDQVCILVVLESLQRLVQCSS